MDYKNELNSDDDFDCSNGFSDNYNNNSNNNNNNSNSGYMTNEQVRLVNPNGLSKAELRKTNKPIMEKRRRARINHCLNELKTLILEAMKKDPARHSKLEKADILEMTVKHLQSVQRQQLNMAIQTDPSVIHKFKNGFVECAEEVNRYISQLEGIDTATRQRLNNHLNNCATSLEQIGSMTNFHNGYRHGGHLGSGVAQLMGTSTSTASTLFPAMPQDLNNNSRLTAASGGGGNPLPTAAIQMNGVQLIPSRLPSGELALIVPNAHANLLSNSNMTGMTGFPAWPVPPPPNTSTGSTPSPAAVAAALPLLDNAAALPTINSFATQLQRMSAFSKPPPPPPNITQTKISKLPTAPAIIMPQKPNFHTTTAAAFHQPLPQHAASPPLSPISSVSSLSAGGGDDSSSQMHTSSDLQAASRATTPPHDTANAILAQQHSFSGVFATPPISGESSLSTTSSLSLSLSRSKHLQQQQVSSTSGSESINGSSSKRSLELSEGADSSNGSMDEPAPKRFAPAATSDAEDEEENGGDSKLREDLSAGNLSHKQKLQIMHEDRDSMWRPW